MKKIGITADCTCDLPDNYFEDHDIGVIYFYITTDTGKFRDGYEIDSQNIIEYLEKGGTKAVAQAPQPMEYELFFEKQLEKYDEIIHISLSDRLSISCRNAREALQFMGKDGKRVTVIDSGLFSSGMAFMIMKAVEMRDRGCTMQEITEESCNIRDRISASFVARNADYLCRSGLTGRVVKAACSIMMMHPVMSMKKGRVKLKSFQLGDYDRSVSSYIRSELRNADKIDRKRVFITHAGCDGDMLEAVKKEVMSLCSFDEVIVTSATAAISSTCGAGSIGVLFLRKYA